MLSKTWTKARVVGPGRTVPMVRTLRQASSLASFHYLSPLELYQTTKPFYINVPKDGIPGHTNTNEESTVYDQIPVTDLRARRKEFLLERQGFEVAPQSAETDTVAQALAYDDFMNPELIVTRLGPVMENFLKHRLGAEAVYSFGFRVRRRDLHFPSLYRGTQAGVEQPVQGVHADFTPDYARTTATYVGRHHPDLSLHDRRWQIISAWRPLFGPLRDWPLALLDFRSIDLNKDLIPADNVYPHQVSETYHVFYNENHRWYYLSEQCPNEILIFKAYDSMRSQGIARLCPHAAFALPQSSPDTRRRESIECLSLVLYPKGTAEEDTNEQLLPSETPSYLPPTGAFSFG